MALQIRTALAEDIPRIMSLFNSHTTPPKSAYFFEWWNRIPSVTYCAVDEEEIVGMFVVLRRRLVNHLNCGVLMGLIVKNEWRGRSLFKTLGDQAMNHYDDVDLFCCLTNATGEKTLKRNFNFRTIGKIETMAMAAHASAETDVTCQHPVGAPITPNTKFENFKMERGDAVMFLADEDFRKWRYALHPRCSYQILRSELSGYVITNRYYDHETKRTYGDIVDFETPLLEDRNLVHLLHGAYLRLRKEVDVVTIQAVPHSILHAVVKKMGFHESPVKHFFCMKVKDSRNEYLYNSSEWLIKWGDYLR